MNIMNDSKWLTYLTYLVDIVTRLYTVNKSLQGAGAVVTDAVD